MNYMAGKRKGAFPRIRKIQLSGEAARQPLKHRIGTRRRLPARSTLQYRNSSSAIAAPVTPQRT